MRFGLISDSHDDKKSLKAALRLLRQVGAERLIHCGDLTSAGMAQLLKGWPLIFVAGNRPCVPLKLLFTNSRSAECYL